MSYITGISRDQVQIFCIDEMVAKNAEVRIIDKFVDKVIKDSVTFTNSDKYSLGRPSYNPYEMIKLYIYGYYYGIKSSRKLAKACLTNLEVMWLMDQNAPDFRTISDFRKNNIEAFEKCFLKFIDFCKTDLKTITAKDVFGGCKSVDGTKIRAVQAKDGCYTAAKIDDKIEHDKEKIAELENYINELNFQDAAENDSETKIKIENANEAIEKYQQRLEKHTEIKEAISETETQYAENDPDARLMKTHYGAFVPSMNVQTAVDSESHMIESFQVTSNCTDHGLILSTVENAKEDGQIVSVIADAGYDDAKDMQNCLENGVIPNVCLGKAANEDGIKLPKKEREVTFEYEPNEISEEERNSTKSEDLKKCLHAGVIPECYKDQLLFTKNSDGSERVEVEVREITISKTEASDPNNIDEKTEDEMKELAKLGYFVRDIKNNKVYCPAGETLFKKSTKNDGSVRYCNKLACKQCKQKNTCFKATKVTQWKEVDFSQHSRIKGKGELAKIKPVITQKTVTKKKLVVFRLKMDTEKLKLRKCTSEHPFGTIKRNMNGEHFLLRGRRKVTAEMALTVLGYNIKRLTQLFSLNQIFQAMTKARA